MMRKVATFGGWTLVSRVLGFVRDILMAAVLGAGPIADAFFVAFRLPNHFRALLGEGAFQVAFVPLYAKTLANGAQSAKDLQSSIAGMLFGINALLLVLVFIFTSGFLHIFAPGLVQDVARFELAIEFTRITFGFLMLVTLTSLYIGVLNASGRFAMGAAAPVALNLAMIGAMLVAYKFTTAGHAASYGVLLAGFLELGLVLFEAKRFGLLSSISWPKLGVGEKHFFKAFFPAVVGSAGVQVAMFADTLLATMLPVGAVSALYYADRLYQLPVGIFGVAVGTVLLAESARKIASGNEIGAYRQLIHGFMALVILAVPATLAFLILPDLLIKTFFMRGQFDLTAAQTSAQVLFAYGLGLPAVLLIRAFVTPFQARGDTKTPMKVALIALTLNVIAKFILTPKFGVAGLAFATSLGAWLNLIGLMVLAKREHGFGLDQRVLHLLIYVFAAGAALAAFWSLGLSYVFIKIPASMWIHLGLALGGGALVYLGILSPAVLKLLREIKR